MIEIKSSLLLSLAFGMGLLAATFSTNVAVKKVRSHSPAINKKNHTTTAKPAKMGGWNIKLSCQKSFSGNLSVEMKSAETICNDPFPSDHICKYYCQAILLDFIVPSKNGKLGFHKENITKVLETHLTKAGGKNDVARILKQVDSCKKHLPLLQESCVNDTKVWECLDTSLTCK